LDHCFQIGAPRLDFVNVGESHRADELSVTLESRMFTRDLRSAMEHNADEVLRWHEAGDIAFVAERRVSPFDGFRHAIVGQKDYLPSALQSDLEGMFTILEPLVNLWTTAHRGGRFIGSKTL
jgi:hypothetical protein